MSSRDISSNLDLGILSPTPAVSTVDGQLPQQNEEAKARRRLRAESEKDNDGAESASAGDQAADQAHQFDSLA